MTKKVIIIVVVIFLLLAAVGGGLVYMMAKKAPAIVQQAVQKAAQQVMTKGSLKDLLLAGNPVSCTIKSGSGQMASSGITYVSGKNIRADFTTTGSDNKVTVSHMIQDGTYTYIWMDDSTKGTKIKVEAVTAATGSANVGQTTQASQAGGVDVNSQVEMICNPWIVDQSKFVPPTTVQFTDLSQTMQNLQNIQKSACDKITDPTQKAACLSALGGSTTPPTLPSAPAGY